MSADSDLLFPQADALVITDLGHLPEYEDFTKHLLLESGIDSVSGSELLLDLEGKSNVSMLSMGDFNDFNTFSTIAEEEEEEEEEHVSHAPSEKVLDFTKQQWFVHGDPKKVRLLFYLHNVP
eukprot:c19049_g1_i1 orf=2-364(-)